MAERLGKRRAELLAAEAEDIGTPASAPAMELEMAVEHLRTMKVKVPYFAGKSPYGTVATILPYDATPVVVAWVGGAAILGGNQFHFNCSSQTSRLASLL